MQYYNTTFCKNFTPYQIELIERVLHEEMTKLLQIHGESNIELDFMKFYRENPYLRFSAASDEPRKMWFKINSYLEDFDGMIIKYFPAALAHEFHHMIRHNYIGEYHLAELCIMEGLAIHFAMEVTDSEYPRFIKPLSNETIEELLPKIKADLFNEDFNNRIWQRGSSEFGIPKMFAYTLGYHWVLEYFKRNTEKKASNCFALDCRDFLPDYLS